MKFSQIKLTEAEKRLKDELRAFGADLQSRAQAAQEKFEPTIAKLYDETTAAQPARRPLAIFGWLRRPLLAVPVALVMLIAIVSSMRQYRTQPVPMPALTDISALPGAPHVLAPQVSPEVSFGETAVTNIEAPEEVAPILVPLMPSASEASMPILSRRQFGKTFKERFLGALGRHEADPDEVASRPQVFEQDMHAELMSVKSQDEVASAMRSTFESLGGFVESINTYHVARSRDSVTIRGKVPVRALEAFRTMLRNFAGEDKYYRERTEAYNRTADVAAIEGEREKVEKSIAYLEDTLARETNPQKRAQLEAQLEVHRARLREREATREAIQDRVEYADVSVAVSLRPDFWHATSLKDFRQLYVGFNDPTLLDKFKINGTAIALLILHALSYFFWLIPIIWWIWWRKRRHVEAVLKEVE